MRIRSIIVRTVSTTLVLSFLVVLLDVQSNSYISLFGHAQSEIDRAGAGPLPSSALPSENHGSGFDPSKMDKGLDTLNSDTVWEDGSPQNSGWTDGDYSVGTGIVRDNQYAWWQRHLLPQQQYDPKSPERMMPTTRATTRTPVAATISGVRPRKRRRLAAARSATAARDSRASVRSANPPVRAQAPARSSRRAVALTARRLACASCTAAGV